MSLKMALLYNILLVSTLCFFSLPSKAQDQKTQLRDLSREYECYTKFQRALDLYKLIVNYKLGDENYSLRLNKLIHISSDLNQKFTKSASEFKNIGPNGSLSAANLDSNLREVAKMEKKLEATLHDLEVWEAANLVTFISLHDYVFEQLAILNSTKARLLTLQCGSLVENLSPAIENLENWVETLSNARLFIVESRRKRQLVFNYVQASIYRQLTTDQLAKMANDISNNADYLASMVNYTRVSESFFEEWLHKTRFGIARGLDTQYLLYDEPLRLLRELLVFLDSHESKIMKIKGIDQKAKQELLNRINTYKKSVKDRLDLLMKKGWQGQFEKQKFLTQERIKRIDRFPEECKAAISRFKEKESTVKDLADFHSIQNLYGEIVVSCLAKN
jgi:hypothetical protein